jgi:hypothetical protein
LSKIFDFLLGRSATASTDPVRQKIDSMLQAGQQLHLHKEDQLSESDIKFLNKELRTRSILIILVFSIIGLLFSLLGEGAAKFIGFAMFALMFPIAWYQQKEMKRVISEGKKQITRGIITKKFTKGSSRKENTITYYLTIGEMTLDVSKACYNSYEEGDAAEFHTVEYPKRVTFIITHQKLVGAGLR